MCLPAVASAGAPQNGYLSELTETTVKQNIAQERGWRILLHYPDASGGESRIDDPAFFLEANGKQDPEAELQATLAGLFAPAELGDKHPRCRYPARETWLVDRLGIDTGRLPQPAIDY